MAKNDGGPAFPHREENQFGVGFYIPGMSLRDWFAGQVLPQVWTEDCNSEDGMTLDEMAHEAYRMADAMLAERAK